VRFIAAVVVCTVAFSVVGCAGARVAVQTQPPTTAGSAVEGNFIPASRSLTAACHATALTVGYPVPCPTRVPADLTETGVNGPTGCALHIIAPGGVGGCAKSWRHWVIGSSTTPDEHLVITASPTPLRNYAKLVNGPAWYPAARVKPLTWLTINGWRMRAVFVPQATNDGSAFAHHVVLIWTVRQHTYGIGFHDVRGIQPTLTLDEQLAESIQLVGP
jgi:hypothetical protein